MSDENKIPVPNTVGELIEILEKFPKDASLHTYKVEGYYNESETESYFMSVEHFRNIETVVITLHWNNLTMGKHTV